MQRPTACTWSGVGRGALPRRWLLPRAEELGPSERARSLAVAQGLFVFREPSPAAL